LWGAASLTGLALTHLLRWVMRRAGWLALPPAALWLRIVLGTVLIATLSWAVTRQLSLAVYGSDVAPITAAFYEKLNRIGQLRNQYIIILMVHGAWMAIYLAFAMQRRRYQSELRQAQMGEALRGAELRLLKSQLNPHFLFNSLNGLRSLIGDDQERAREAVTQLSRLLRYSLATSEDDLVTLERELELVDDYLALESMRLAQRLHVERDIEPAARAVRVPAMLLQTLVENAIKHGIAALKQGGTLRIGARIAGDELVLRVDNPRPADASVVAERSGVGLRNAAQRLQLLFGERARLHLDLSQDSRASAEARVPA
jgi:LytS/YehU family sensor histidine kinase